MADTAYFFDSYAFIEIAGGNPNYAKYADALAVTSKLNLFEVFYNLLREGKNDEAYFFLQESSKFVVDFNEAVIEEAANLKFQYKERKLSMADCIGYALASRWKIRFLTGDRQFEQMDNVEFVK